jgi:NADPH-dependent ferric siderophore reductase
VFESYQSGRRLSTWFVRLNVEGRSIHNLFHASENEKEAESELKLWFNNDSKDIHTYDRSEEGVMYSSIMYKE